MKTFEPYLRAVLIALALVVCFGLARAAEAKQKPPLRVAVLDLNAPKSSQWLGPAVSESLAAKLAGLDGLTLVEREQVQTLLLAKKTEDPTPELLGADYLITGSVQLVGTWPDEAAQIRLTTKLVASETATLKADAATILDGTVGKLFTLESDLADQIARSMGLEPTRLQTDYREERSTKAKQLFGEGLLALQQAEALTQGLPMSLNKKQAASEDGVITSVPVGGSGSTTAAGAGPEAVSFLQSAIQLFRQAQQANEGAFFAGAHHYEARARELLAKLQQNDDQRRQVREDTIKQFRQDTADAAPAFFDLGRALQANGAFEEALEAHAAYIQWALGAQTIERWTRKIRCHPFWGHLQEGLHLQRLVPLITFAQSGDRISLLEAGPEGGPPAAIVCLDRLSGKVLWRNSTVPAEVRCTSIHRYATEDSPVARGVVSPGIIMSDQRLFYLGDDEVSVLNAADGSEISRIAHRLSPPLSLQDKEIPSTPLILTLHHHQRPLLVVSKQYHLGDPSEEVGAASAIDLNAGRVLWTIQQPIAFAWSGAVYASDWTSAWDAVSGKPVTAALPKPGRQPNGTRLLYLGDIRNDGGISYWAPYRDRQTEQLLHWKLGSQEPERTDCYLAYPWGIDTVICYPGTRVAGDRTLLWDVLLQKWRLLNLPESLMRRLSEVFRSGLENSDPEAGLMFACGDKLWTLPRRQGGLEEIHDLRGSLLGRRRTTAYTAHRLFGPDESVIIAHEGLIQSIALLSPSETPVNTLKALLHQAECYLALGKPADALETLQTALRSNAYCPRGHLLRAQAYREIGNAPDAYASLFEALSTSIPHSPEWSSAKAQMDEVVPVVLSSATLPRPFLIEQLDPMGDVLGLKITSGLGEVFLDAVSGSVLFEASSGRELSKYAGDWRFIRVTEVPLTGAVPRRSNHTVRIRDVQRGVDLAIAVHDLPENCQLEAWHLSQTLTDNSCLIWGERSRDSGLRYVRLIATCPASGRHLWAIEGPIEPHLGLHLIDEMLLLEARNYVERSQQLFGIDLRKNQVRFRQARRQTDSPNEHLLSLRLDMQAQPLLWNGLVLFEAQADVYGLDLEHGDFAPLPRAFREVRRTTDEGSRGQERREAIERVRTDGFLAEDLVKRPSLSQDPRLRIVPQVGSFAEWNAHLLNEEYVLLRKGLRGPQFLVVQRDAWQKLIGGMNSEP